MYTSPFSHPSPLKDSGYNLKFLSTETQGQEKEGELLNALFREQRFKYPVNTLAKTNVTLPISSTDDQIEEINLIKRKMEECIARILMYL